MITDLFFSIKNEWLQMAIQMVLAVILGGLIGLEREYSGKTAGFRTYALVCLGSTIFTSMSFYVYELYKLEGVYLGDLSRIASQVVVGIGFIGAGLIIHRRDDKVTGLTTAAGLWVTSSIGMALGFKLLFPAIFGTILVLIILWLFRIIEYKLIKKALFDQQKEDEY